MAPEQVIERRIRHLISIQVCNLTPFPLRDTVASALSKPTEQFVTHGHLPDDLDATLSRKRSRRISSNSTTTLKSLHSDERRDRDINPSETRARKRTTSSPSTPANRQTTTRSDRARTPSISSTNNFTSSSFPDPNETASKALLSTSQDNSQLGLETVLKVRLVETFLAIYVLPQSEDTDAEPLERPLRSGIHPSSPTPKSPNRKSAPVFTTPTEPKFPSTTPTTTERDESPSSPTPPSLARRGSFSGSLKAPTGVSRTRSWNNAHRKSTSSLSSPVSPSRPQAQEPSTRHATPNNISTTPDYLSPIHRPSTNPSFSIFSLSDYAYGTDLRGRLFEVEVWAKTGSAAEERKKPSSNTTVNGREKQEVGEGENRENENEWHILERWNVDLGDLVPLSEDPNDTLHLPSNTLILTLDSYSTARRFYVPQRNPNLTRSRSPSPEPSGYASDPETDARKVKDVSGSPPELALPGRRLRRGTGHYEEDSVLRTACWQDLFKLVSLQTCMIDTNATLESIVEKVDKSILENLFSVLRREISERESRLTELKGNYITVSQRSQKIRDEMLLRREQLKHRRAMLALAWAQEGEHVKHRVEIEEEVVDERSRYSSLLPLFRPARSTLISTLASIFPIELLSPPDLLYTILDVPLPIPLSSTDPAPPSFLPNHKGVNEETVAAALGYAALVVHLLAVYLGKGLMYPITYVGSRSLIRDSISVMVGPRMFPLFSKGVDTYRYEYGVFLLNKDIELLMAEFDLRATDIRHTLPNLKNLLLTLTDGVSVPVAPLRSRLSPVTSLTELESLNSSTDVNEEAEREPSSPALTVTNTQNTTPKANSRLDLPPSDREVNNANSPTNGPATTSGIFPTEVDTASGGVSPSEASLDTRKKSSSSRFKGLSSPLAGLLRYPGSLLSTSTPSTPAAKDGTGDSTATDIVESTSTPSDSIGSESNGDLEEEDLEQDRRTIRGCDIQEDEGVDQVRESKSTPPIGNGHRPVDSKSVEKHIPVPMTLATPPRVGHVAK
ncbi:hypothetical protein L218DRAFT_959640 [Marasmius fiardii PR-910]|nr:hypothetical protein L218DRAFT_959640 [Marasmius fiardii PR-910]